MLNNDLEDIYNPPSTSATPFILFQYAEISNGSNKYFLAYLNKSSNKSSLCNFQKSEVSKIEWKPLENCLESIRPYSLEKKQLIVSINKILDEYKIY